MNFKNFVSKSNFASDNYSGICPEAMEYFKLANEGYAFSYGEDRFTLEACNAFRELFEVPCEVFFVFTGTAGNSLALASLCKSYQGIICHRYSHVETDECGAPEFFSHGAKLFPVNGENGKMDFNGILEVLEKRKDIHYPRPRAISITQATEMGTLYSFEDLQKIALIAKQYGLKMHMDGARFANAVAASNLKPRQMTVDSGVDVLCFGGAKNGLALGEAIIFFDLSLADEFAYRCKQAGQLASKMRFIAAPWVGILKHNAWLRYARHANECAKILESKIREISEVKILFPSQANSVFIDMPEIALSKLKEKGWHFYTFIGIGGARFVCSWNTTEESIISLTEDIKASVKDAKI